MKQKILYIITKSGVGGAQKYVTDLTENLDKELFETNIIYGGKDLKWLSNEVRPWFLFYNDLSATIEIIKNLNKYKPDILHLNSSKAGVIGSLAVFIYNLKSKNKVRVIFTAHGWVFNPTNTSSTLARLAYIFLHQISALFQDEIICVSEYDHKLAKKYFIAPEKKLSTIHNGIDADKINFLNKNDARQELINKIGKLNVKKEFAWIGTIGRLVKEKDYQTLIEAIKFIPEAYLFLIGKGVQQKQLKTVIKKLALEKRVFIIEPTNNDAIYLRAFDVFAMSSVKEGLPYVLLEAMAAELPVVVTSVGGIPEIIKDHNNGMMVSYKNPETMARAIEGIVKNPGIANELKIEAKKFIENNFELSKMINKTMAVYKKYQS